MLHFKSIDENCFFECSIGEDCLNFEKSLLIEPFYKCHMSHITKGDYRPNLMFLPFSSFDCAFMSQSTNGFTTNQLYIILLTIGIIDILDVTNYG